MMKRLAPLAVLLMLPAASQGPLGDRVAGAPVECVSNVDAQSQLQIIDARTIGYSRTAKRLWVTHPEGHCGGLRQFQRLVVQRGSETQLCRGDRFRTLAGPSGIPSGLCAFGPFTPYDKIETR